MRSVAASPAAVRRSALLDGAVAEIDLRGAALLAFPQEAVADVGPCASSRRDDGLAVVADGCTSVIALRSSPADRTGRGLHTPRRPIRCLAGQRAGQALNFDAAPRSLIVDPVRMRPPVFRLSQRYVSSRYRVS